MTMDEILSSIFSSISSEELANFPMADDEITYLFPELLDLDTPNDLFSTLEDVSLDTDQVEYDKKDSKPKFTTYTAAKSDSKITVTDAKQANKNALKAKENRVKKKKEMEELIQSRSILLSENTTLKTQVETLQCENTSLKMALNNSNKLSSLIKCVKDTGVKFAEPTLSPSIIEHSPKSVNEQYQESRTAIPSPTTKIEVKCEGRKIQPDFRNPTKTRIKKEPIDGKPLSKSVLAARENRARHKMYMENLQRLVSEKEKLVSELTTTVKALEIENKKQKIILNNSTQIVALAKMIEHSLPPVTRSCRKRPNLSEDYIVPKKQRRNLNDSPIKFRKCREDDDWCASDLDAQEPLSATEDNYSIGSSYRDQSV